MTQQEYRAQLTGEPFLLYELRTVAALLADGLSVSEASQRILSENLFQYKNSKSAPKRLRAALRRIDALSGEAVDLLAKGSSLEARLIAFYALLKTDRMLREFMAEVYREKRSIRSLRLEDSDVRSFFNGKAEQDATVRSWTPVTFAKLRQVYVRVLYEAGFLDDPRRRELTPPTLPGSVVRCLQSVGDTRYLPLLGLEGAES